MWKFLAVTMSLCLGIVAQRSLGDEMKQVRMERLLAKLEKGEQVTIVALGDSNTELTFHTRGRLNWPLLLQESLFEKYGPNRVIMINAARCGTSASDGLQRLERDVFRFKPDLLIVCYWGADMQPMREIVEKSRAAGIPELLLRTPNPVIAPNMPDVDPPVKPGKEWPGSDVGEISRKIVALAREMNVPVCDHYSAWIQADSEHRGPATTDPNKLWMRMSDASHPNDLGHLIFYRELAPFFGLPDRLSWEE